MNLVLSKNIQWGIGRAVGLITIASLAGIGCAKQRFEAEPSDPIVKQASPPTPTPTPQSVSKVIGAGKVDILIINDNSGSMSVMQSRLGSAFGNFISSLGNRDWRIAMTTTDIYARNGNLLDFGGGIKYLTPSMSNAQSLFVNTVYRSETVACEQSGYNQASCPSSDERGTFAAHLALSRNENGWLRSDAATAVIFLANEDVRSDSSIYNNLPGYELQTGDRPETLIGLFDLGGLYTGKIFQAHSIIIIPGDSGCLAQQTTSQTRGYYGTIYRDTSNGTIARGWGGTINNICATDYSSIASGIGVSVNDTDRLIQLPCTPKDNLVQVTLTPANTQVTASYNAGTNTVSVSSNIPAGTRWTATFTCQ